MATEYRPLQLARARASMGPAFNDINCTSKWASANNIFMHFNETHKNIIKLLQDNPKVAADHFWTEGGILQRDSRCMCKMISDIRFGPSTPFTCAGCRAISTLTNLTVDTKTFQVVSGDYAGWNFNIYVQPAGNTQLSFGCGPAPSVLALVECLPCKSTLTELKFIGCDSFTQFVLSAILWQDYGRQHNFPTPHVLAGFICNEIGYLIMEENVNITKFQLQASSPRIIFWQVLYQLRVGQQVQLILGSPTISYVQICPQMASYPLPSNPDRALEFPFRVLLMPTINTSLNVKGRVDTMRLFPCDPGTELRLLGAHLEEKFVFRDISCDGADLSGRKSKLSYQLSDEKLRILLALRHAGIPVFQNSLDVYLMFLSLMCYKTFYDLALADHFCVLIWHQLWTKDDLPLITSRVIKYHDKVEPTERQLLQMLCDLDLQCDPIPDMVKHFG